ncbi:MAG: DOMON-like domain-containing protein [Cyanobacteria bacterium]|nr:DOMON-like domain-containing protein [Cyanobacteriota bacterium]
MSSTRFKLIPHPGEMQKEAPAYSLHGRLNIIENNMQISYYLEGELSQLRIPNCAAQSLRQDLLWQCTCLEFFLAAAGNDDYWEYNLSPTGYWNVYHLESYRQGLAEESAYKQLPFNVTRGDQQLSLSLTCALPPSLVTPKCAAGLEVGVSAVLQSSSGELNYWAVAHPSSEPDFHHRAGFCLKLA